MNFQKKLQMQQFCDFCALRQQHAVLTGDGLELNHGESVYHHTHRDGQCCDDQLSQGIAGKDALEGSAVQQCDQTQAAG